MTTTSTADDKAQELLDKGLCSLEEGSFNEALHYFNESNKLKPTKEVEDKIKECKEKIKEKKEKEKEKKAPEASSTTEPGTEPTEEKSEDEIECEKIIEEKDYYKLLNVSKETIDQDELKKAYKKLAIKFHPDKNKSSRAEEAFKKISTAYQTLNDPEKRKLYDKYGTEEEFREKYYQANQQRYQEEDEYDIFDILFQEQGGRRRMRRRYQPPTPEQQQRMKYLQYVQVGFILFFILYNYLPILLAKKPLYIFERTPEYTIMKKTLKNKVSYFANKDFDIQFSNKTLLTEEEINIEKAYVDFTYQKCIENKDLKSQYEYKLWYSYKGSAQYYLYLKKINELDFSICDVHNKLKVKLESDKYNKEIDKEKEEEVEGEGENEAEEGNEIKDEEDPKNKNEKIIEDTDDDSNNTDEDD